MLTFHSFLEEGLFSWLKDSLRRISNQIKTMLTKLKPGGTARISLKHSQHLQENKSTATSAGGGGLMPIVGVLAEWLTASEIFDLIDKYNKTHDLGIKYQTQNRERIRKITADKFKRALNIYRSTKNPNWDGVYTDLEGNPRNILGYDATNKDPKVIKSRGAYMTKMMPSLRDKCQSSAKTIFNLAIENLNDHNITEWDIECTGQSDGGRESTADLIINKMEKGKIVNHFDVSLKTICGDPETTRGKSTNPINILASLEGITMPGKGFFQRFLDKFPISKYGDQIKDVVEEVQQIHKEWAESGKGNIDDWHAFVTERKGYNAIQMGALTWVKLLNAISQDRKEDFVKKLFEELDLRPDAPVLVASGTRKGVGTVTAIKSPSPEVIKEWNKAIKTIELRLDYDASKRIGSSSMKWIFSINGVELPAIGAQVYCSPEGGLQFAGKANELISHKEIEKTLETKFGLKF